MCRVSIKLRAEGAPFRTKDCCFSFDVFGHVISQHTQTMVGDINEGFQWDFLTAAKNKFLSVSSKSITR